IGRSRRGILTSDSTPIEQGSLVSNEGSLLNRAKTCVGRPAGRCRPGSPARYRRPIPGRPSRRRCRRTLCRGTPAPAGRLVRRRTAPAGATRAGGPAPAPTRRPAPPRAPAPPPASRGAFRVRRAAVVGGGGGPEPGPPRPGAARGRGARRSPGGRLQGGQGVGVAHPPAAGAAGGATVPYSLAGYRAGGR